MRRLVFDFEAHRLLGGFARQIVVDLKPRYLALDSAMHVCRPKLLRVIETTGGHGDVVALPRPLDQARPAVRTEPALGVRGGLVVLDLPTCAAEIGFLEVRPRRKDAAAHTLAHSTMAIICLK